MLTKDQIKYIKERLRDVKWEKERKIRPTVYFSPDIKEYKSYPAAVNQAIKVLINFAKIEKKKRDDKFDAIDREYKQALDLLALSPKNVDGFKLLSDFEKGN